MQFDNRVTEMLGVDIPIVQAPMGFIARAQLASAVSETGAFGIIETSSGQLEEIQGEIRKMRELTDKPFGVNIAQAFIQGPGIIDFVIEQGVRFVTTSAGDPRKYTETLKAAGLTVFHVVPSLRAAVRAVEAGVDGLVVEGGEGGGFKNPREVSTMVLLPLVRSKVDVPIIAAGGICDGPSMAAAFALGAEGVQLGTRMVSAAESPIHQGWKDGIVAAEETDTVFLRGGRGPALRALRTATTERVERERSDPLAALREGMEDVYFHGKLDNGVALTGQVAGRIDKVMPVRHIVNDMVREFEEVLGLLAAAYLPEEE